jgi:hypothetical protein
MNEAMSGTGIEPVVKSLLVRTSAERAFDVFTAGIDRWWPRATHSVSREQAIQVVFESRHGGSIHEIREDGARFEWGRVTQWDPPRGVRFTWYPGREAASAQLVEVRFETVDAGTRVTLTHTGWEALGEDARTMRDNYDGGWDLVFTKCFGGAFPS